jgi:tetratricopeptide (TPR) repeat protein
VKRLLAAFVICLLAGCGTSGTTTPTPSTVATTTPIPTTAAAATTPAVEDTKGIARRFSTSCTRSLARLDAASRVNSLALRRLHAGVSSLRRQLERKRRETEALRANAQAAMARARADPTASTIARYRASIATANAAIDTYNRAVRSLNAVVAQLRTAGRRYGTTDGAYRRELGRCLRRIDDWDVAVRSLQAALVAPALATGETTPTIVCDSPDPSRKHHRPPRYERAGYVLLGSATIHLSATTCLALERVIAHPNGLGCAKAAASPFPTCANSALDSVVAIATLAHEQQHVDGIANEARAQCYALQKADRAAAALGVPESVGRLVGRFTHRAIEQPPEYRSRQCRSGGNLDLRHAGAGSWRF